MTKKEIIEKCEDCGWCRSRTNIRGGRKYQCTKDFMFPQSIDNNQEIPDFCPLEDDK